MSEERWWENDDHPDAASHREFLAKYDANGLPLKATPNATKYAEERDFERMFTAWVLPMAKDMAALKAEVAMLKEAPAEHKGAWRQKQYRERSMVQYQGSCWFARVTTSKKPGESRDWVLCAKRGADGKDAK